MSTVEKHPFDTIDETLEDVVGSKFISAATAAVAIIAFGIVVALFIATSPESGPAILAVSP